jgi:hypothetical protein
MFGEVTNSYMYIVLEGNVKGEDRWGDIIKTDVKEIDLNWIHVIHIKEQWRVREMHVVLFRVS